MNTALISALKIYDIVAKLQTIGNCYWIVAYLESERIDKSIGN